YDPFPNATANKKRGTDQPRRRPSPERIEPMPVIDLRIVQVRNHYELALAPPSRGRLFGPCHREFIGACRGSRTCRSSLLFSGRAIGSDCPGPPALDHLAAHLGIARGFFAPIRFRKWNNALPWNLSRITGQGTVRRRRWLRDQSRSRLLREMGREP